MTFGGADRHVRKKSNHGVAETIRRVLRALLDESERSHICILALVASLSFLIATTEAFTNFTRSLACSGVESKLMTDIERPESLS